MLSNGPAAPTQTPLSGLEGGHRYSFLKDEQYWREFDHQNVQTVYVVRIKPRETVVADQFSSDYFEIIDFLPGDEAAQTREEWEQRRKEQVSHPPVTGSLYRTRQFPDNRSMTGVMCDYQEHSGSGK